MVAAPISSNGVRRPLRISTGTDQASATPARWGASSTSGHSRGSRSSMVASILHMSVKAHSVGLRQRYAVACGPGIRGP